MFSQAFCTGCQMFETNSIFVFIPSNLNLRYLWLATTHGALTLHAMLCQGQDPPPHAETKSDWQEGSCERHQENKQACKCKLLRPAKLSSSFLFIIQLIDLLIIVTGLLVKGSFQNHIRAFHLKHIQLIKTRPCTNELRYET